MSTLERALEIATEAHAGQVDKAGRPYIEHVLRVVEAVEDYEAKAVAAMHDIIEDCPGWDSDRLRDKCRMDDDIVDFVCMLTRGVREPYPDYIARLKPFPIPRAVKLADLRDNADPARLALLPEKVRAGLAKRYAAAMAILDPSCALPSGGQS